MENSSDILSKEKGGKRSDLPVAPPEGWLFLLYLHVYFLKLLGAVLERHLEYAVKPLARRDLRSAFPRWFCRIYCLHITLLRIEAAKQGSYQKDSTSG